MKITRNIATGLTFGLFTASSLYAQVEDTMVVIDQDTSVAEVANNIELPERPQNSPLALPDGASDEGRENSAFGLETANQARASGREFGQQQAEEARNRAREDGREFGQQQAEEARVRGQDARISAGESARDNALERARGAAGAGQDAREFANDARNNRVNPQ